MTEEHLAEDGPEQPGEVGDGVDHKVIDGDHPDHPPVLEGHGGPFAPASSPRRDSRPQTPL